MKTTLIAAAIAAMTLACSKKDKTPSLTLSSDKSDLKYDETTQINASIGNNSEYTWTSSDEFVGEVSSSGRFEASHIGETTITAEKEGAKASFKITVSPTETFIVDPFVEWGETKSYVKNKETRELRRETTNGLIYNGISPLVTDVFYLFDDGSLGGVLVNIDDRASSYRKAKTFCDERYEYEASTDEGERGYLSKDEKTMIAFTEDHDTWGVGILYFENSSSTRSTNMKALMKVKVNR